MSANHPQRPEMTAFSAKLKKLGFAEMVMLGPTKTGLAELREKAGLNENLNKVKARPAR